MPRPALRAALLSLCMASFVPALCVAQGTGGDLAAPVEAQRRLSIAPFATLMPIATIGAGDGLLAELEKAIGPSVTAIVLESGSYTLSDLAAAAAGKGLATIEKNGASFSISAPLVVWKGAELKIGKGEHLVLDASRSSLILNAGSLSVTGALIEGSISTDDTKAYRPFILTVAGGEAVFEGSEIRNLGFSTFAETSGLSFLGRGYAPVSSNIQVRNNDISNLISVSIIRSAKSSVTGNRLTAMRSSGIVLQSASNAAVRDNSLMSPGGHGIRITSQSQEIDLQDNMIHGSKGHGIFVDDGSVLVAMVGNHIDKSGLSGIVLRQSGCSTVSANTIANSALSGIRSEASFGVDILGNAIARNREGITLEEQTGSVATNIRDNVFTRNIAGIRSDLHGDLILAANDFSGQWPRLFAGPLSGSTGRYLASRDLGRVSEFLLAQKTKAASVQMASFSAFGLAACNPKT